MDTVLTFLAVFAGWWVLQVWVLPRLGVPLDRRRSHPVGVTTPIRSSRNAGWPAAHSNLGTLEPWNLGTLEPSSAINHLTMLPAAVLFSLMIALPQDTARVIPLWPEGVPNAKADGGEERVVDGRIYNVQRPTLLHFPAPAETATGTPSSSVRVAGTRGSRSTTRAAAWRAS